MSILAIALTVGALVIIYMACALSYRQIVRACIRRRVVARLKSSRWRANLRHLETDHERVAFSGTRIIDVLNWKERNERS